MRIRRSYELLPSLLVALALALAACSDSDSDPTEVEPDPEPADTVDLVEGTTIGTEVFPIGNTAQGGQGDPVGGIGCIDDVAAHYHAHLSLFVEGERIAIPAAVGAVDPVFANNLVTGAACLYWIHTHDATGLIHIEPPAPGEFTLGDFFDIWGQPLSANQVATYSGELSVFVDGVRYEGDPREIVLVSRMHVSLQVGRPLAPPPMYNFQG
ncbi:MAG TPA: hypothetical protein VFQ22_10935 [Longimicrobiales bacterium]|nr:hypothetical protein [Longimicrobiales bacterium]